MATAMRVRAGVERVLDQLLDDRGRPLDDLAGGDLIGKVEREAVDRHRFETSTELGSD